MPGAHLGCESPEPVDGQVELGQVALDRDLTGGLGFVAKLDADEFDVGAEDREDRADFVVRVFEVVLLSRGDIPVVWGRWLAHGLRCARTMGA